MQNNQTKSRIGINKVSTVVENLWECGWQEYGAQNDDAFDGVIIMKRGSKHPVATGGMLFTQVKCGSDGYKKEQKQHPNHIGIALGGTYIDKHLPRWSRAAGPPVLIFVDDEISRENPSAYWVDLRLEESFSTTNKGMVLVPRQNKFAHHAKGDFHRLCGSTPSDNDLYELVLSRKDSFIPNVGGKSSLRADAARFYDSWRAEDGFDMSPALGPVIVNRLGWEHITRPGRLHERIVQSWLLLGAARRMIRECVRYWTLGNATSRSYADGNVEVRDFVGLRARVSFPHRHSSVVQVVLQWSRLTTARGPTQIRQKIRFYSVYELRRGSIGK